jgi:hypothetical protein
MPATWRESCDRNPLGHDAGSFTGGPPKLVLHSTETGTWPSYQGGTVAPHETWAWRGPAGGFLKRQHVPHNLAAMAMKNASGGVQTNRDGAHQIELIGSCDAGFAAKYRYPHLPSLGDDFLHDLGVEIRLICAEVGIDLNVVSSWRSYPGSYGLRATQRLSLSQWDAFGGILGHQHAAENDHGDPGDLDVARALSLSGDDHRVIDKPAVAPARPVVPAGGAPGFPLPSGHYFGPKSGPTASHSGYYGAADRAGLRVWQKQVRKRISSLGVDGLYGPATANAARTVQRAVKLDQDSLIGKLTWLAAWQ